MLAQRVNVFFWMLIQPLFMSDMVWGIEFQSNSLDLFSFFCESKMEIYHSVIDTLRLRW